ncbi:nuclear GTPase SLIP-GC-like isoform X2 [Engraulis encrasicolus]|uniref:nuclear GTPase SLIP-GC-like isoform X2 n=1 Tax=Engraulis encrasicolus TaxID=184585 RepID=UPI002FCF395A
MDHPQNMRIVLLGKNELDNALMGNLIVRRDAFQTEGLEASEEQVSERVRGKVWGRLVTVINPPDLFRADDTLLTARVKECVFLSAPGPHAFILVLRPGNFTEMDRQKVKSILSKFGHEALSYTIVVNAQHEYASFSDKREDPFSLMLRECDLRLYRFHQSPVLHLFDIVDRMMEKNRGCHLACADTDGATTGTSPQPGGKHTMKRGREVDLADNGEGKKKKRDEKEIIQQGQGVMVQVQHKLEEKLRQHGCSSTTLTDYISASIWDLQKIPSKKTTVGVFGPTGCGKSSLLNAILGEPDLLPTGSLEACTSVIIQVEAKTGGNYRATIDLISEEEWRKELKSLLSYLEEPKDERNERICKMAEDKIKALYGHNAIGKSFLGLLKGNCNVTDLLRSTTISFTHSQAQALSKQIRPYIRHREDDFGKLYWPIVKAVKIEVPKQKELPENIVLVDLPGNGDNNQTRDEMWKEMLRECTVVWIVSDINRAVSDKAAWDILDTNMADMVEGGECTSIAFICTKTDAMHAQSYMRSEELTDKDLQVSNDTERKRKCILHRNNIAKDRVGRKAYENYNINPLVFTVSSQEFRSKEHLQQKDTEIPYLREGIKTFYDSYTSKRASQFLSSAIGILHLFQASGEMNEDRSRLRSELLKKLDDELLSLRRNRLRPCLCHLERCITGGVQQAADQSVEIIRQQVKAPTGKDGCGFHQTLGALCRNKGYFRAKDGQTRDLNKALADGMQNSIKEEFNTLFLNQGKKGQSVQEKINEFSICSINVNKGYSKPEAMDHILHFIGKEEAKLKARAHGLILKTKKAMYASIRDTIKEEMTPAYERADEKIGTRSMLRKTSVLVEHVESLGRTMFNKAKAKMLGLFNTFMDQIESDFRDTLQKAMANALTESLSTFNMDVSSEIKKMEELLCLFNCQQQKSLRLTAT